MVSLKKVRRDLVDLIRRCQQYFNYNHPILIKIKPKEDKDIYCYPFKYPPEIHVCKKWLVAYGINKDEAFKRVVHEMLHIVFKLPDDIEKLHFYSHPWKDALSKTVYEDIGESLQFDWEAIIDKLERNLADPYWMEELKQNGRLGWW